MNQVWNSSALWTRLLSTHILQLSTLLSLAGSSKTMLRLDGGDILSSDFYPSSLKGEIFNITGM